MDFIRNCIYWSEKFILMPVPLNIWHILQAPALQQQRVHRHDQSQRSSLLWLLTKIKVLILPCIQRLFIQNLIPVILLVTGNIVVNKKGNTKYQCWIERMKYYRKLKSQSILSLVNSSYTVREGVCHGEPNFRVSKKISQRKWHFWLYSND
jgi:hypothetical protein